MGNEPIRNIKVQEVEQFTQTMKKIHTETQAALLKAQTDMKRSADKRRTPAPQYQVGDQVMLSTKDLSGLPTKLAD